MNGPRLAAITLDPRGGGVAVASRLMWRALTDGWGEDCSLVTLNPPGNPAPAGGPGAVTRLTYGARMTTDLMFGRCAWVLYSHLSLARIERYVPVFARRRFGVFLHGIEAWGSLDSEQRAVLERATLLMANSHHTATRVREAHPWMGSIAVCPLALVDDPPADAGATDVTLRSFGPHAVLTVGRMNSAERYKGHDELIDAWPSVRARVPDAVLVIVGTGDDQPRLAQKAARLVQDGAVVFAGFVSDRELDAYYRQAALFAMPSREEGFGLVYLEAMTRGVPCVGSLHDAAREVIEHGLTGTLVAQSDVTAMADAIARLLEDEPLRRRMGEAARQRVRREFGYQRFARQFSSLLTESMDPAAAGHTRPVPSEH